jgi:hypothetical protein
MLTPIDAYCERLGPGFWAEPVNALTNLAFLIAAWLMWRRTAGLRMGRALAAMLGAIGVGSFLFHTFANGLTAAMDVAPILGFILLYLFAANRDLLGLSGWWALAATAAFLPYAALTVPLFEQVPALGSSAGYAPIPVLIVIYAALQRGAAGRGFLIGAGLLCVSLALRTIDGAVCGVKPLGTHYLWHVLNAVMLAWMIEVWLRHRRPGGAGLTRG